MDYAELNELSQDRSTWNQSNYWKPVSVKAEYNRLAEEPRDWLIIVLSQQYIIQLLK